MSEGITEQLRILERLYQIQTELVGTTPPSFRTTVFDSGRIVAIREAPVPSEGDAAAALDEHHRRVVESLVHRVHGDGEGVPSSSGVRRVEEGGGAAEEPVPELPPVPEDPALVDGLRVRQLYGDLRRRLHLARDRPASERLATAEAVFRWIVGHPLFPKLRLDEQLRFHRILDRLTAPEEGSTQDERWVEVVEFGAYLNAINRRGDLVAFDRELLTWLEATIGRRGVDPSTLTPMRWIFGRDDDLDELLEEVATTDRAVWAAAIRRVLDSLEA